MAPGAAAPERGSGITRRAPAPTAAATAARNARSPVPSPPSTISVDGEAADHLRRAAVVVARGVGEHERRQPPHPRAAQQPGHAALGRPGVEQHGAAVGVLDQGGVALAHVEERDRERGGRPGRGGQAGEGQRERRAGQATAARRRPAGSRRHARAWRARGRRAPSSAAGDQHGHAPGAAYAPITPAREPSGSATPAPGHLRERASRWPPSARGRAAPAAMPAQAVQRDRSTGPSASGSLAERGAHHAQPHDRRHQRQRDHVGRAAQPPAPSRSGGPSSGAVASVAAAVTAIALGEQARQRRAARSRIGGASSEDPGHRRERELPSGVARSRAGSARGSRRRRAAARTSARPAGTPAAPPARPRPSRRPAAATARRRRAARRGRSARSCAAIRAPRGSPAAASSGSASAASSITFWPLTASRWARPESRKSSTTRGVDALVLAEHHPAGQRGLALRAGPPRAPARRARAHASIAPARPPRRRPVARALGTRQLRRRCRGAAGRRRTSKPPRAARRRAADACRRPRSSVPGPHAGGSRARGGSRASSRAPRARPAETIRISALAPNAPLAGVREQVRPARHPVAGHAAARRRRRWPRAGRDRAPARPAAQHASTPAAARGAPAAARTAAPRQPATSAASSGGAAASARPPASAASAGARSRALRGAPRPRARASRRERLLQRLEPLLPDPLDLTQLLDRAEAAVLVAELDDPLGQRRADPVELVELLRRGGGEAERRPGALRPRPGAAPRRRRRSRTRRPAGRPRPARRG